MAFSKKKTKDLTPEQKEQKEKQKQQRKFRKMAYKDLIRLAEEHPQIKYKLIEKEFGITLPEYDPVKESEQKLEKLIVDKAIDTIKDDRDLQEQLALRYLHNKAGDLGIEIDSPEVQLEKQKEQFRQTKEIMEMLGIKTNPSILDALKNPMVIAEIIKLAGQFVASRQASPAPESNRTYAVEVDGKLIELTAEEHTAYKLLKNKLQLAPNIDTPNSSKEKIPISGIDGIDISKTNIQPEKHSDN